MLERIERSTYVFTGTVIDTNINSLFVTNSLPPMITSRGFLGGHSERFFGFPDVARRGYYALIQVDAFYKGGGIAEVAVEGFGAGSGDCMNTVLRGERLLFFATGNAPMLRALYFSYPFSAAADLTDDTLTALETLTLTPPDPSREHVWLPLAGMTAMLCWAGARGVKWMGVDG